MKSRLAGLLRSGESADGRDVGDPINRRLAAHTPAEMHGTDAAREETYVADGQWLRALFDAHFDSVWRFLSRHGVHPGDVDDVAQQVFLTVARKSPGTIDAASERSYLFGVALRIAQNHRRSRERRRETQAVELDAVDAAPNPEEFADQRRARELLERILDSMPEDVRAAFVMFEVEQLTMAEIAHALAVPPGTIASRLRRGREIFQRATAQWLGRGGKEGMA